MKAAHKKGHTRLEKKGRTADMTIIRLAVEQDYDAVERIMRQVNARNTAAREMYEKYGFAEKSINMEFLGF